jgi:hypothetical protein
LPGATHPEAGNDGTNPRDGRHQQACFKPVKMPGGLIAFLTRFFYGYGTN